MDHRLRPPVRARLISSVAILALGGILHPTPSTGQTISGRVLEEGTDRPVAGALVALADEKGKRRVQVLADSVGRFSIAPGEPGQYVVEAERLGYETMRSPLFAMKLEGAVGMDLVLVPQPIGLEGLEVSTESEAVRILQSYGHTPAGLGPRWIDRSKIEKVRTATRPGDVLRWQAIPGIRVRTSRGSPLDEPLCVESSRFGHPGCALTVLNGVVVDPVEVNQLDPSMIEAMAVLTPSDAATIYGTQGGNGAILIWTRAGGG